MITRVVVMVLALFWGFQQGGLISEYYLQLDQTTLRFAISLFTALVLALSSLFAFWLFVFVIGCFLGYQLALLAFGTSMISVLLFTLATGIAFAVLERWLVIGLSSFAGAWLLVISIALLFGVVSAPNNAQFFSIIEALLQQQVDSPVIPRVLMFLSLMLIGVFGFAVQMYLDSTKELKWLR